MGSYGELVTDLSRGRHASSSYCHLDPDIVLGCLPRRPGWRGALGQVSSAQGHLTKQNVGIGDVFIFWSLFRHVEKTERWEFIGAPDHRIWGWLQIGEVIHLGHDGTHALDRYPWLVAHPHTRPGWRANNVIYVASNHLTLGARIMPFKGCGTLKNGYRLSATESLPSVWTIPAWLNPALGGPGMTYHSLERWHQDGTLRSTARGQEFVATLTTSHGAENWLIKLLMESIQRSGSGGMCWPLTREWRHALMARC